MPSGDEYPREYPRSAYRYIEQRDLVAELRAAVDRAEWHTVMYLASELDSNPGAIHFRIVT